jgi:GR25 family glycosyltransferase involved in LPS biosynthesis
MSKVVGFLTNKLTLRGTEIAMYDYADYNETLLKNKSIIIARDYNKLINEPDVSVEAYDKFKNRFKLEYYQTQKDIDNIVEKHKITHLYIIKAGYNDNIISTKCKNFIHCVFNSSQPHGQVYSVISDDINRLCNTNYPVVPHMIRNDESKDNLRNKLNIPQNAIVFGRYGGLDTFDIPFVYDVIKNILNKRNDIYFLFMNTNVFYKHKQIIYLDGTTDMKFKKNFINTCDALLHARAQGETFGLTCGEFAVELKPVITWNGSRERNHLKILGDKAVIYNKYDDLYEILNTFAKEKYDMNNNGYFSYSPENVMKIFSEIYFSGKYEIQDLNFCKNIDKIIYINLDSRKDRNEHIIQQLNKYNVPQDKILRFSAIRNKIGAVGCTMSHIKVIEMAIKNKWKNILVLEDDFVFNTNQQNLSTTFNKFMKLFGETYDVFQLTYWYECLVKQTSDRNFFRVERCDTTSGYLVNSKFYDTLLKNFKDGLKFRKAEETKENGYNAHNLDEYWKKIQKESNWYIHLPVIGKQLDSYSDIRNAKLNYNMVAPKIMMDAKINKIDIEKFLDKYKEKEIIYVPNNENKKDFLIEKSIFNLFDKIQMKYQIGDIYSKYENKILFLNPGRIFEFHQATQNFIEMNKNQNEIIALPAIIENKNKQIADYWNDAKIICTEIQSYSFIYYFIKNKDNIFVFDVNTIEKEFKKLNANKYILCRPEGGFVDIMHAISACYNYCKITYRTLLIDLSDSVYRTNFANIFDIIDNDETRGFRIISDNNEINTIINSKTSIYPKVDIHALPLYSEETHIFYDQNNIPLEFDFAQDYHEDILYYRQHRRPWDKINDDFVKNIKIKKNYMTKIYQKYISIPKPYLAIHIRNTDMKTDYIGFYEKSKKLISQFENIYLATDSIDVLNFFKSKIKNNLFCFTTQRNDNKPIHHYHNDEDHVINDFLTDIIICAEASYFISGNMRSGFSQFIQYSREKSLNKIMFNKNEYEKNNIKDKSKSSEKQKLFFLSFGGGSEDYHQAVERIGKQAESFGIFDEIKCMTELDLQKDNEFWEKHKNFILNNKRGYGYWIWRPYLIHKIMTEKMNDGDIIVFIDAGCELNICGKKRFLEYIDIVKQNGTLAFQTPYPEKDYTKTDLIKILKMEDENTGQIQGGMQFYIKCKKNIDILNQIYKLSIMMNYRYVDDSPSIEKNDETFKEHRHEQSILSLLLKKNNCHYIKDETYFHPNWRDGIEYPIWAIRNRSGESYIDNYINYNIF